jgi:septum formation protein
LHSGVALAYAGQLVWSHVETAHMHVRELREDFINSYLAQAGNSVLSSVGAYQYEGLGIHLFESIVGDQSTILGLPLLPLLAALRNQRLVL